VWDLKVKDFTDPTRPLGRTLLTCKRKLLIDDDCILELPASGDGGPPGQVLRVIATASILDGKGNPIPEVTAIGGGAVTAAGRRTAVQEIRLGSHFIRASKSDSAWKVMDWFSTACDPEAGPELRRLALSKHEGRPDESDLRPYRREYYARMLRHGVELATVDGRITLDELAQFVDMTQAFGNPPELGKVPPPPTAK
jgi:hypothetical protein